MQQTITLPYLRTSPVHVPRRDLVLSASDSLLLNVAVVESDRPSAQALILTTDADGPSMQLVIWHERHAHEGIWWDYGHPYSPCGTVLQSVIGVPGAAIGSWDFHIPTGTFHDFPRRCGWSVLLLWDNGLKSEVLAQGIMNFLRPFVTGVPLSAIPPVTGPPFIPPGAPSLLRLLTDDRHPIITSNSLHHVETS